MGNSSGRRPTWPCNKRGSSRFSTVVLLAELLSMTADVDRPLLNLAARTMRDSIPLAHFTTSHLPPCEWLDQDCTALGNGSASATAGFICYKAQTDEHDKYGGPKEDWAADCEHHNAQRVFGHLPISARTIWWISHLHIAVSESTSADCTRTGSVVPSSTLHALSNMRMRWVTGMCSRGQLPAACTQQRHV